MTTAECIRERWRSIQPESAQSDLLRARIVRRNEGCDFGRRHGFSHIRTVREYQEQVPICTYEDLRVDVDRMLGGEQNVLVTEPVKRFFLTSGSTAAPKYVPITSSFVRDKWAAFQMYWTLLRDDIPQTSNGVTIANFSDGGREFTTPGGALCSSESSFWSAWSGGRCSTAYQIPRCILNIPNADARDYCIARVLVETDIAVLMALNPSTILRVFETINLNRESLLDDVLRGGLSESVAVEPEVRKYFDERQVPRAQTKPVALQEEPFSAKRLWPHLQIAVSWRSPMLKPYLELLEPYLDGVQQRDYITMASEGVMAIPFTSGVSGGALALDAHFFEFIPEGESASPAERILLAHELERDRTYRVVLSTSAGLYRYYLGDVVRVTGFFGQCPIIEFLYRAGRTCSMTGEKLTEHQVAQAVSVAAAQVGLRMHTFTLCPVHRPYPHYALLMETDIAHHSEFLAKFVAALDRALAECNLEYRSKRSSKRLGAPEVWVVASGSYAALRQRTLSSGVSDSQIKATYLTRDPQWHEQFTVLERIACASQV